jgi:hypothetical protein
MGIGREITLSGKTNDFAARGGFSPNTHPNVISFF